MGFGGSRGIYMDGVIKLQHSKSSSDRTTTQEDESRISFKKIQNQKIVIPDSKILQQGDVQSEIQSKRDSLSKDFDYLNEEVLHLEKQLEDQVRLRQALELCLSFNSSSEDFIDVTALPESAAELIEDVLELRNEVTRLEKYLSSIYLKAFSQKVPRSFPPAKSCSPVHSQSEATTQQDNVDVISRDFKISNSINDLKWRCQSSLSKRLSFIPESDTEELDDKAFGFSHSLPKLEQFTSGVSLAKRIGTRIADLLPETPNRLSEDMIKCMSAVYCKLSNTPLTQSDISSQNSKSSSTIGQSNQWSPASSFDDEDVKLDNPFNVDGILEPNGAYSTLVEVSYIFRDEQKLGEVEHLLQDYQSIISRLEDVDPSKLTHEEKIAFWINVHNSLVMNSYVALGIPHNNLKRGKYLHKAAYTIGGHSINADTIQSSILRCRMSHIRHWKKKIITSRLSFRTGDEFHTYAIDKPEPLLHFALSTGNYSDPAVVHAFTPMDILHELETAKNEYIRATLGIKKNRKIFLPKLVESYSRDSNISNDKVLKTILQSLPESYRKRVKKCLSSSKSPTTIEWVPHNFSFRYLISKELAKYSVTHRSRNA